ncbi:MAG: hypothetical protein ACJA0Q_001650 [Saprospiraceae bacterium]|jgi:hypothetical protein
MPKKRIILKRIGFLGIAFFMSILLVQCGMRGTPTGGPKDEQAPQITKSSPENFSTNFTGKKITIKFDEYVQIKSFKKNFLISPPVKTFPKYRLSGKTLILSFDSTFNENTTYTLFFGESIVDLNENNVLDSNMFVFSTGDILDSLTLSGTIHDALTEENENDMLVHLYKNFADSAPSTVLPTYFAVVKDGRFKFTNLASGSYKIFALKDGNNNYLYDLPDEKIAFSDELMIIPNDSDKIELHTFQSKAEEQKIFKPSSEYSGQILLTFNKPVSENFQINFIDSIVPTDSIIEQWNNDHDSLTLYSALFNASNKYLLSVAVDTLTRDSLKVKIGKKALAFSVSTNYRPTFASNFNMPLIFSFNKPLASFYDSCFYLVVDSVTHQITGNTFDKVSNQVNLNYQFKENSNYKIIADSAAFTSLLGETLDSLKYDFPTSKAKELGNLILIYDFPWGDNYVLELLQNGKVVQQFIISNNKGTIDMLGLLPAKYSLKIVIDENADKRWSPGSYIQHKQSEEVKLYSGPVNIRANWDVEVVWEAKE